MGAILDKDKGKAILNNDNKGMTSHCNNNINQKKNKRCDDKLVVAAYQPNKQRAKALPDHFE
jgi:hypothetical protein